MNPVKKNRHNWHQHWEQILNFDSDRIFRKFRYAITLYVEMFTKATSPFKSVLVSYPKHDLNTFCE